MSQCSLCECEFDLEAEGGSEGVIGTFIHVAFCPTCYAGIWDMVQQRCQRCIEAEDD